jgi:hypothetical protein
MDQKTGVLSLRVCLGELENSVAKGGITTSILRLKKKDGQNRKIMQLFRRIKSKIELN